jgi:tetratricopeptide (TPR) repeat protein
MGQYEVAIEELEEALRIPRSALSQARARSARAFAVGMAGDLQAALANFRLAERVIPDSGWLHYWRALCLLEHGFVAEAVVGLDRALQAKSAALNRPKRERARELLEALAAT